jgi:hypothetical protein
MRTISQIPAAFPFQSYFDSTLEHLALLEQPTNQSIVASTKKTAQGSGYVVGVSGSSDVPVAFNFYGSDSTVICRPGQLIKPGGRFDGFDYGLPFGWLGGGRAVILVGRDETTEIDLGSARPDMVFHRTRLAIEASGANLPTLKRNWPLSFPWTQALRGSGPVDQRGTPIFRVHPTRALLRLRSAIVADTVVGLVFRGSREFDEASDGTYTLGDTTAVFCEVTFAPTTDPSLAHYPMASIPEDFLHLTCDEGGLTALGLGVAGLTGVEIDVVRFGRL